MQINPVANLGGTVLNTSDPQSRAERTQNLADAAGANQSAAASTVSAFAVAATTASEKSSSTGNEPSKEERRDAVEKLNSVIKQKNESLQFSIDDDTDIRVVKLIDMNTKETVRQFPSEEIVNIARAIDKLQGMLVRDKA
nr:flagellar protein FlaG [uncultured Deefgea sp.]